MTIEEKYAQILFDNLNGWQDRTLVRIGRRIKATGRLSAYDQKALKNIVNITGDMNAIYADLARATGQNIKEVQTAFERFMSDNMALYKPLYDFRNIPFLPYAENPIAQQIVNHWVKETAGEMINLSRTKALAVVKYCLKNGERVPIGVESLKGAYQSAIDKAVFNVTSGVGDFYSNMRDTIEDLGGSGVRIDYGNGVTRSIDSVIRQNMLFAVKQMQTDYDNQVGKELGCDGFEVNFSATCRPSHAFMEGRMFSKYGDKTVDGKTYPDGAEALARLNDYNCHHRKMDVILGVSEPRYNAAEIEEKNRKTSKVIEYDGKEKTRYEWIQKQREIEREVRKQKTTANMAKAAGDNQLVKDCNTRIKALKAKYNDLTESVGLQKTEERMRATKPLTGGKEKGIIQKDIKIYKSVGAAPFRDDVLLPNGNRGKIKEDSTITKVVTFAGQGTKKELKVAPFLEQQYKISAKEWRHTRGDGYVVCDDGKTRHAELHWFECDQIGRIGMKVKRYFDD